ncbi:hypothetical protein BABINDRAFT_164560 [Babjeviella inositovora NRRL Y-12698]|uniref:Dihydrofolate synthetase n=1 Tax=Babjeviella inositovora NRRL Y-12698 TaxID=984486 RepID=A0A1E3QYY5_9ASCO|nr:uncharacterized protein BABINDRAFT_164560 [Babjeviella inositovora NRRL Y-12698]ODQ82825.1 hypothetical protein BABINDRAFT_164560 [Babjeviella inositovora NRRL Y-12698]
MPIDLGLQRISLLLLKLGNPQLSWKTVHVAGTNGKGSVVAYLSLVLTSSSYKTGRFTSPHLIRKADCVCLNNVPVLDQTFALAERRVLSVNEVEKIGATEFEILTATAFEIFHSARVQFAVIEVGLGGRLDATNVIPGANGGLGVVATGVTKIGLDHEGILGNTIGEIACEKAGIAKQNIPMVVDATNEVEALASITRVAGTHKAPITKSVPDLSTVTAFGDLSNLRSPLLGEYQLANLMVALNILQVILPVAPQITPQLVIAGVESVQWPGRLQKLTLYYRQNTPGLPLLLDGAHNGQSAVELSRYLAKNREEGLTFVIAITRGKSLAPLLSNLLQPQDKVVVTLFGPVDGMPWIACMSPAELRLEVCRYVAPERVFVCENQVAALDKARELHRGVVVCGSLYLVGDLLRAHERVRSTNDDASSGLKDEKT